MDKRTVETKIQELNQALITDGFDKVKSQQADQYHQEWEKLCKQEEIFWRQNRAHNKISSMLNNNEELQTSLKNIEDVLVQHFRGITKKTI